MRQALTTSALAFAFLFAVSGCERPEDPMLKILESTASQTREFKNSVSQGLNRWAGYSKELFESTEWNVDSTLQEILEPYRESLPAVSRMDGSSFLSNDAQYLQAVAWLDLIANRVKDKTFLGQFELMRLMADDFEADEDDESPVDTVVQKLNPDLSGDDAKDLSLAIRLFDWVTRNIQLDETPSYTEEEIEEQRLVEAETLAASGLAAPGAKRTIWDILVFARGDYMEKAKLFIALCDRMDLPCVMLATGEDAEPWAVGVSIGDDFYLFDTKMGLPIPGSDGTNVATLSSVMADASLLTSLDLTVKESLADDTKYWVTDKDLEKLTGLVYWDPVGASRRIAVLEDSLIGDQKMQLVSRADETIAKLPKLENVQYKAWDISLQTNQFRQILGESMPKAVTDDALAQRLDWYFPEEGYVMRFANYRTARSRFFRGKFEKPKIARLTGNRDAIESFAMLMYEDETIAGLQTDRNLQMMIGVRKPNQTPAEFEQEVRSRQAQMRLVRRDAGLFMCQSHFDHGSLSTTANWVPKLLAEQDVQRWEPALNYLYARALESRHQYDEAIEQLKTEGPQQHGNLIRARLLKQQIETHFANKTDEQ